MTKKSDKAPRTNSHNEPEAHRYFGDVTGSFVNGIRLDIRARLAIEFLKAGMLARPGELAHALGQGPLPTNDAFAGKVAAFVLDLATAFVDQSIARGLTKDLPETAELTTLDRLQIERQVRSQIWQQHVGNRIMREEADRVATPPPGIVRT